MQFQNYNISNITNNTSIINQSSKLNPSAPSFTPEIKLNNNNKDQWSIYDDNDINSSYSKSIKYDEHIFIMNTFNCSVEEAESNDGNDIKCIGDAWYTSLTEDKASSKLLELGYNELTPPKHDPIWLTWDGSVSSYIIDLDYITNLYFVLPDVVTLSADLMGSVSSLKPSSIELILGMAMPCDMRVINCTHTENIQFLFAKYFNEIDDALLYKQIKEWKLKQLKKNDLNTSYYMSISITLFDIRIYNTDSIDIMEQ